MSDSEKEIAMLKDMLADANEKLNYLYRQNQKLASLVGENKVKLKKRKLKKRKQKTQSMPAYLL
jgi:hypothetical protein